MCYLLKKIQDKKTTKYGAVYKVPVCECVKIFGLLSLYATLIVLKLGNKAVVQSLTWLYDPGLGPQVGQVHISLPAINYGVGILAGSVSRGPVCHGHLNEHISH